MVRLVSPVIRYSRRELCKYPLTNSPTQLSAHHAHYCAFLGHPGFHPKLHIAGMVPLATRRYQGPTHFSCRNATLVVRRPQPSHRVKRAPMRQPSIHWLDSVLGALRSSPHGVHLFQYHF